MTEADAGSRERRLVEAARRQVEQALTPAQQALPREWPPGYRLVREIHRGGQGVVYLAHSLSTAQEVAIKVIQDVQEGGPGRRERLEREVRVLARLKHPGIVAVRDKGECDGWFYCVMDFVPGEDLDQHLRRTRPAVGRVIDLLRQIAEAVAAAHAKGVIHRDLKPANIRIDPADAPRILDFGLARVAGDASHAATRSGAFIGSAPWASPEQVRGTAEDVGLATDVYALGVVGYHMLTGRLPYDTTGSLHHLFEQILNALPVRPGAIAPGVDADVDAVVLKCLEKDPARRYGNAAELADELRRLQCGAPISARRHQRWYVVRKSLRRHRMAVAVGLAFAGLLTAFIAHLVTSRARLRVTTERLDATLLARDLDGMARACEAGDRAGLEQLLGRVRAPADDFLVGLYRGFLGRCVAQLASPSPLLGAVTLGDGDIAFGTWNGGLVICEPAGLREVRRFEGLATDLRDLAWHRPSARLVACGSDGVLVIDPATGAVDRVLPVPTVGLEVLSVADERIVAGTLDGRVFAWRFPGLEDRVDLACVHPSADRRPHAGVSGVAAVALSARHGRVATAGRGAVRIWRLDAAEPVVELTAVARTFSTQVEIRALALDDAASRVAVAVDDVDGEETSVMVLDITTGSAERVIRSPGSVGGLVFSDPRTLVIAGRNGPSRAIDLPTGVEVALLPGPSTQLRRVLAAADGSAIVTLPSGAGAAALLRLPPMVRVDADLAPVAASAADIALVRAGVATLVALDSGAWQPDIAADVAVRSIASAGDLAALCRADGSVEWWRGLDAATPWQGVGVLVALRADAIASATVDGDVWFGNLAGSRIDRFPTGERDPCAVALDPAADRLAITSTRQLQVLSTGGVSLLRLAIDGDRPTCLAFLDRDRLAVGRSSGVIDVYDATRGDLVTTLSTRLGRLAALRFDAHRRRLLIAGSNGIVLAWQAL